MRLGVEAALVGGEVVPGDVTLEGGRVAAVGVAAPGGRGVAVPGFVDLQVNGFAGVDFLSAGLEGYPEATAALASTGVTRFQPTLITSPPERLTTALRVIGEVKHLAPSGARVVGAHLEGPFLSPRRPGTHPVERLLPPDPLLAERLLDAGPVTYLTLAPELPGALELIRLATARGVVVALGHSDADAAAAHAGFDAGAVAVTHLFNAMPPFLHRRPGLAGVALARPEVVVTVVLDGAHLAEETVQVVLRAAAGRVAVVTDAIAAAGKGEGRWRIGEVEVEVREGTARRKDGTLAGSVGTMDAAFRRLLQAGADLATAVEAVSHTPGRLLGRPGELQVGAVADVVVLDDRMEVVTTYVEGEGQYGRA